MGCKVEVTVIVVVVVVSVVVVLSGVRSAMEGKGSTHVMLVGVTVDVPVLVTV